MIRVKRIMVPVDFSEPSKKAVNYGLSLALKFKARLVLAHIVRFDAAAYLSAKTRLLELIPVDCRDGVDFELIVKSGEVRQELLAIVEDRDIDLVVMGSHGRSYFERMLLGSVTERMLRKLHVPVLTVSHLDPEKELRRPGPVPLRRLLYATDMTEGSEAGLKFSIRLARGLDAQLTVVHISPPIDPALFSLQATPFIPDFVAKSRAEAAEQLNRLVGLASDGTVPITTVSAEGKAYERINALAEEHNADLIVINLRNKGRLELALLGATAEGLIRTATVPVLSLPIPATYMLRWAAA